MDPASDNEPEVEECAQDETTDEDTEDEKAEVETEGEEIEMDGDEKEREGEEDVNEATQWTQPLYAASAISAFLFVSFLFDWQSRYNIPESATQELLQFLGSVVLPQPNIVPTYAQAKREAFRFVNTKTLTVNGQKFTHIPMVDQLQSLWGEDYFREGMEFPLPQRTDGLIEEVADTPVFKEFQAKTGACVCGSSHQKHSIVSKSILHPPVQASARAKESWWPASRLMAPTTPRSPRTACGSSSSPSPTSTRT